jgi:flagellar motor switch protein FliM
VVIGTRRKSRHADPDIRPYDFRRPTKLSRDHTRVLEMSMDTFVRQWTTVMTTSLRVVCNATLSSIQQLTYDEYVRGLPDETCMLILTVDPMPGAAVFELPIDHAMTMVDHLLGGNGGGTQPDRPLSEIEWTLVRGVAERVLRELRLSCEEWLDFIPDVVGVEYQPQFASVMAPSDLVLALTFELQMNAHESVATICLPFNGVFPALEKAAAAQLIGRERGDREAAARAVRARMGSAPIEVGVQFSPTLITMADIVSLQPGDVLPLAHTLSTPLAVVAEGITFAYAVPGSEGRRLACLIVEDDDADADLEEGN